MKIGLLEDSQVVSECMTTALRLFGHIVSTHTTGASLLEALSPASEMQLLPYDLVIMDLDLPGGLSGQEVVMMVHSNAATNRLPILIISGTHKGELERVRMRFPSIPILRKPFKFRDLAQYIDQCCSMP